VPEAPSRFKDCLVSTTIVELSWADRLRVLLTGRLAVGAKTVTEFEIGRCVSASATWVLPWRWLERNYKAALFQAGLKAAERRSE
jgi:hypothetical protein